jgi:hypothetical protein
MRVEYRATAVKASMETEGGLLKEITMAAHIERTSSENGCMIILRAGRKTGASWD